MNDLFKQTATDCVELLKTGQVSALELVQASIERIEQVDHAINALPEHCFDRARKQASMADTSSTLAGLPIAVKDYNDAGGVRTTYGSPLFTNYRPESSDVTVGRLEHNGATVMAKSNVPEWAGGNTFNPVYGETRNPWNLSLSAGGSSGGSAAALASGQVWLATGNDLGGSLRTPSSFNGVVGLRPGPGRVPRGKRLELFDTLWVEGPMARNVPDLALMLEAGCGAHPQDPISFDSSPGEFINAARAPEAPTRVAFSADLNGQVPMASEVSRVCAQAMKTCAALGTDVTDDIPDFSGVTDAFQTLRAVLMATLMGELLETNRQDIAPDIVGNIERGLNIRPEQIFEAQRCRWRLHQQIEIFFASHDLLICPAASVLPFPIEQRFVDQIDGRQLDTYIDWFSITFALSMSACPVLSLPCGFSASGLPVGIQVMGPPRGEAALLQFAAALEHQFGVAGQVPIDPAT